MGSTPPQTCTTRSQRGEAAGGNDLKWLGQCVRTAGATQHRPSSISSKPSTCLYSCLRVPVHTQRWSCTAAHRKLKLDTLHYRAVSDTHFCGHRRAPVNMALGFYTAADRLKKNPQHAQSQRAWQRTSFSGAPRQPAACQYSTRLCVPALLRQPSLRSSDRRPYPWNTVRRKNIAHTPRRKIKRWITFLKNMVKLLHSATEPLNLAVSTSNAVYGSAFDSVYGFASTPPLSPRCFFAAYFRFALTLARCDTASRS